MILNVLLNLNKSYIQLLLYFFKKQGVKKFPFEFLNGLSNFKKIAHTIITVQHY